MDQLENEFHEAMVNIYRLAAKECNYRAKAFLAMVTEMGGVAAAKKLLGSDALQSGLYELFECGRLDLTVEALVCQPKYEDLFSHSELAEAKRRLDLLSGKGD